MRGRRSAGAVWHSATTRRKSSTDSSVVRRTLARLWADVGAIVPFADRQYEIHLVHAERQAALGASEVRDQRRHSEPGKRQRVAHDGLGVGELREELGRDERADLDLTHAGGVLGIEPGDLLFSRQDLGDALQAIAEPDFADMGMLAHSFLPIGYASPDKC